MPDETNLARESQPNLLFSIDGPLRAGTAQVEQTELGRRSAEPRRHLWIMVDEHTKMICHIQQCWGETAEERVHELYQVHLKRCLPKPLLTDNGSATRAGGRRSDGDV